MEKKSDTYEDETPPPSPDHWQEDEITDAKRGDTLTWTFWFTGPGYHQAWIAFPNEQIPQPQSSGVIASMSDLQKRVGNSSDLKGETLFLGDGPYEGNLIINARNFTLKPRDGRKGEINCSENNKVTIKLNKTSNVTVSKLNVTSYYCGIGLEESSNCTIEGNIIEARDGFGIYLGNNSSYNVIYKNNLTHGDRNDQHIYIYHSNNNTLLYNNIIDTQACHYYLFNSHRNNLTIHRSDDFYINSNHYILGQKYLFFNFDDPVKQYEDPTKRNVSIGDNWWRWGCCP